MSTEQRGFASMDPNKQREIARQGGRAVHVKGTAHEWTSEQARDAGRKGGIASHRKRESARQTGMPSVGQMGASDAENVLKGLAHELGPGRG